MGHLYLDKESYHSEENTSKNEVLCSTILHYRKKLNILTPQLLIYYIQYKNRKSQLVEMPEAAIGGVLWKKCSLKFCKICRKHLQNSAKFLRTCFLQNNWQLFLKYRRGKNEAREIDCLCCREVDAMLIPLAKIPERKVSWQVSSSFGSWCNWMR